MAVLCLGGVNATASAAVLPLPLLYLLTRPAGVRGRLLAWWAPVTVLAASWWALPLLVLGRYGYDFLGVIETAKVTTSVTGLVDTLRGSDHWLGYLVVDGRPVWTAGWDLASQPGLVVVTTLVAAAGVAGLLLPGLPDRRWLLGGVLLGTVLVSAAHTGVLTGPLASTLQSALDGGLAPLRNVHKADPVLRLPLALGLAHLLAVASRAAGRVGSRVPTRFAGAAAIPVVAGLVAVTLLPAWGSGLAPQGAYAATPAYWQQAADWIDQHAGGERTLLLPSANAPIYRWGTPRDEPLQALASAPWAVRDGAPLGAPGSTRLLDGLDARLATGEPSPAYADVLARAGIRFVLVRNDLDPDRSGSERPAVIRAALAGSPGLTEVARFGPAQPPAIPARGPPGRGGRTRPGRGRGVRGRRRRAGRHVPGRRRGGALRRPGGRPLAGRRRAARRSRGDGHDRRGGRRRRRRRRTPPTPTGSRRARWPRPAPARTRTRSCRPTPSGAGRTTPAPIPAGATRPPCPRRTRCRALTSARTTRPSRPSRCSRAPRT